jgi:Cd2+/Zn2+-exporting ATPase
MTQLTPAESTVAEAAGAPASPRTLSRARAVCVSCARGGRVFVRHYREFLLDPGTLFMFASALLLLAAIVVHPSGAVSSHEGAARPLYMASAFVGSGFIWWSAIRGIRERDFTADIPVSVATIAAIAIGQFSAAAVVAVLLLVGGMLEEFVAARAGNALGSLEKLLPDEVTVRRDGQDVVVALEDVGIGDTVLVRPGERIAVDGEVVFGQAAVNEAAITGESLPVEKSLGDRVYAGTLASSGALEVRATEVGEQTTLGEIRRLIEEAGEQKAPIERILDRYAKLYTPTALLLALILWVVFNDPLRAITMLIVFCPCVMVLATPTALVASIGNAALRGSLVKKGATVEALAAINTVVFDKTGTLTTGHPRLVATHCLNSLNADSLLWFAASAERLSEHPFGRALVQAAEERGLKLADPAEFEQLAGLGVRARANGSELLLGRTSLLAERGVAVADQVEAKVAELAAPGRSVIPFAIDYEIAGLFVLEDTLRDDAAETVARLHQLGLRTLLVSGDRLETAERVAASVGIEEVHAEVLPHEKLEIVRRLQSEGRRIAFVGDGVNDGPALATADVGVAMGLAGTDVAVETADVALLSDDLEKLPHLASVSQDALKAIRQNLAFSLGVLGIAVGLTVPGILHPVTGALLHELSSIPVIMNSARLIGRRSRV